MITHSKVVLQEEDIAYVTEVLRSGLLAQGKTVSLFEKRLASFIGVNHAAAVSSGTAALHLSLLALGVGRGTEVILPSYVCTALLNAVHYVRATPVLVDIDPGTLNIDARLVRKAINDHTAAIIVPHMFGLPADMDEILSLGVPVIEDCAHAVGATYGGKKVGSIGNVAIFSFYATKMLCAGEGGAVLSNAPEIIAQIKDLRDYDEKETYSIRYNYKLTNTLAALGISQLEKLPSFIEKRREIAQIYDNGLRDMVEGTPRSLRGRQHVYYRYVVLVQDAVFFIKEMRKKGIECKRPVFKPLHSYLDLSGFPVTEKVWVKALSIPIYPHLSRQQAHQVVEAIRTVSLKAHKPQ